MRPDSFCMRCVSMHDSLSCHKPLSKESSRVPSLGCSATRHQALELVHSWNTGGEPELISVLHTTASTVMYEK